MKSKIMNKRRSSLLFVCGLTLALSSCTIVQNVTPYRSSDIQEICIIEDPAVRAGFLRAYKRALREKGYKIRILEEHANLDDCELTSTYMGRWKWAYALYMALAEIKVFRNGKQVGEAIYDSRSGDGLVFKKFIKGEEKIYELVNLLFLNKIEKLVQKILINKYITDSIFYISI